MNIISRSLTSLFLLGAGIVSASAADIAYPPPPPPMVMRGPIYDEAAFYIRGDIGLALNQVGSMSSAYHPSSATPAGLSYGNSTISNGLTLGAGVGYRFNRQFRADITGEWRGGGHWRGYEYTSGNCIPDGTCVDVYRTKFWHSVFLANGYFDIGRWSNITPYIGAGIGTAYTHIGPVTDTGVNYPNTLTTITSGVSHKWTFAWALMAGLTFDISEQLKLDIGYRYLNMGRVNSAPIPCDCHTETQRFRLSSHDLRLGLRYVFAQEAILPPPPLPSHPIVRKY